MTVETSDPNALVRIVGARCEKCGYTASDEAIASFFPVPASALPTAFHGEPGKHMEWSWPQEGDCGGRLLIASEPAS